MKIHEYQAKGILAKYGVPVPRGKVAFTVEEAVAAAQELGGRVVVKAQIHAGGRGKGGGVKLANDAADAEQKAKEILGMRLVTHQTGPEGRIVQRLLIEETLPIERELYLGITLDRGQGKNVFMASSAGGMDIEEVAAKTPELLLKETIEPGLGLTGFQARKLAFGIGIPAASVNAAVAAMTALAKAYDEIDASLAEINPFILTADGRVVARASVPWQQVAQSAPAPAIAGFSLPQVATSQFAALSPIPATVQSEDEDAAESIRAPDENVALIHAEGGAQAAVPPAVRPDKNLSAKPLRIAVNAPRPQMRPSLRDEASESGPAMPGRNWTIQIGAYADKALALAQLKTYAGKAQDILARASQIVAPMQSNNGHVIYRARFGLFAEQEARDVSNLLTQRGQTCFAAAQTR